MLTQYRKTVNLASLKRSQPGDKTMKATKITPRQQAYLNELKQYGGLTVGSHVPKERATFEALVKKGVARRQPLNPGWVKYIPV